MHNLEEYLACRTWLDEHELVTISPVLVRREPFSEADMALLDKNKNLAVETDCSQVVLDCASRGISPKNIFFSTNGNWDKVVANLQGKCRFLLSTKEDVKQVDSFVEPYLQVGHLETVAIDLKIDGRAQETFSEANIEEFSGWIRFSRCLAVRSIFVSWERADDLAIAARSAFSLVKKIRSDMPCLFTSFCFEGVAEPLMGGDGNLLKTMQMLAALNDTSLYANFYIK